MVLLMPDQLEPVADIADLLPIIVVPAKDLSQECSPEPGSTEDSSDSDRSQKSADEDSASSDESLESADNSLESADEASKSEINAGNSASVVPAVEDEIFEIINIPGKGTGMIARRRIFPGKIILAEEPLLVVTDEIFASTEDTEEYIYNTLNKLGAAKTQLFLELSDCRTPEDPSYVGIFYTNDMNYEGDAGLFPRMSRANHSCKANAEFISRRDLGVQRLVANYPIEQGEEITINYMPISEEGSELRDSRRAYLREWYGFQCACSECTLEDDIKGSEFDENEKIREEIKELQAAGIENLDPEELETLITRLYSINGKLSYVMDLMDLIYKKTEGCVERYFQCIRGLTLAIQLYGDDSTWNEHWRYRIHDDLLHHAELAGDRADWRKLERLIDIVVVEQQNK
ncbi:uncharacterized protein LOC111696421 isoform X2 [Eurytemora carolleeae]|nr:uncharacterized protein LOC111696421 isoform X2 [Eurytemora carolleeae]|eukprot:XP_023321787.1 uncharacterized protein LOC111696421 isoform X2 [Eurytemora affinis]